MPPRISSTPSSAGARKKRTNTNSAATPAAIASAFLGTANGPKLIDFSRAFSSSSAATASLVFVAIFCPSLRL
jgi:hypothetical protein